MIDLTTLKDFLDLGGTFILALVVIYGYFKQLNGIDEKLVKILTLLTILTKTQTNFNGVGGVLGKDGDKVAKTIMEAESGENTSA
jgi:hypothetical protein